jgi:hypothetical protein
MINNRYRYVLFLLGIIVSQFASAQTSDDMVPKDAVTVFSVNNISLLKKISMDSIIQYEFMEEVQSEMFDGSADNKTLKDAGVDFNQKLNVFYGRNNNYEVSGFTFGISSLKDLLRVFDDFEKVQSPVTGIEYYNSYFNHLILKGNAGLVLRVDPSYDKVKHVTDSIWRARGNGYFFDDKAKNDEENISEGEEGDDEGDDSIDNILKEGELEEDDTETKLDPKAIQTKTYWELKDSVTTTLQARYLKAILVEMFENNIHLKNQDSRFNEMLTHTYEGTFYLDNSRNFQYAKGLWYFQTMFPELFKDIKALYNGNVVIGDIFLKENAISVKFEAHYGQDLGKIYQKLNSTKFDKSVLNYIHEDCSGFFTYNINLKEGYKQAYDIIIPMLSKERDPRVTTNVLKAELLNEFLNTDALFETYQGSMFGTFNGIKKVKTKKIEFSYDENTFEYKEKEIEGEEEMPMFTVGFSTGRADIPEKVLSYMSKMTSRFKNMGTYWKIDDAVFNSIPVYIITSKNGLLVITNDEDLAINHTNGYGSNSLSGKKAKSAKKSKFMYAYVNIGEVINKIPKQVFTAKQNEILDAMRGKEGFIEVTTEKTTSDHTNFDINYFFQGVYKDSGIYLLDLINSAYILAK